MKKGEYSQYLRYSPFLLIIIFLDYFFFMSNDKAIGA